MNATVQGENVKGKEKRGKYQTMGNCPSGVWEENKPQTLCTGNYWERTMVMVVAKVTVSSVCPSEMNIAEAQGEYGVSKSLKTSRHWFW